MLIGTRTSAPDAQQAVVQARLDYQAARDHMERVLNANYIKQAQEANCDDLLPCGAERCSDWSPTGHCIDCSF